jgi:hypothetical protein
MLPPELVARYEMVKKQFLARFPDATVPALPEENPNAAVMVIDEMLAPLQGRPPNRITEGQPMIFQDTTPEYPDHPARARHRAPFGKP